MVRCLPVLAALGVLVIGGCGTEPAPDPVEPTCANVDLPAEPFAVDAAGGATQIKVASDSDGAAVWSAWSAVSDDGSGTFDAFARRIGCDGTLDDAPRRVDDPTEGANDLDLDTVIAADGVLVVWNRDDGGSPFNLSIRGRWVDGDEPDFALHTRREGDTNEGNAWMPRVTAGSGGLVLAGARGVPSVASFVAFVQPLDASGAPDGDAIEPSPVAGDGQLNPALAWTGDEVAVVFQDGLDSDAPVSAYSVDPSTAEVVPLSTGVLTGGGLQLATAPDGEVWMVRHTTGAGGLDVVLTSLGTGQQVVLGGAGLDHTSGIAIDADGAALVAWYEGPQTAARLHAQIVSVEGGVAELIDGDLLPAGDASVAAYPPDVVAVAPGRFFVSWSEGVSPDLRVRAAFLDVDE